MILATRWLIDVRDNGGPRARIRRQFARSHVQITVLLAWPDLYREMNGADDEFFPGAKPARSMARFGADIPGALVAIDAIALAADV